jgi:UDP-2-acetamido-3-amino-2,3-dideoxy-glucuronate N-acetyltransferase
VVHKPYIHPTAIVADDCIIGEGTKVWHHAQIREGVQIGSECIIGKNVYIDSGLHVGSRVKVQNNCSLYHGAFVDDWVFLGPNVILANDLMPRAVTPKGELKSDDDWTVSGATIRRGASVGAGAVLLPGVEIGPWAIVGAGSVVTHSVPGHGLVMGNPARIVGYVCKCGAVRAASFKELRCECLSGDG